MSTLNFNEENKTKIFLPTLTQKDRPGNENFSSTREEQRNRGEVELAFFAEEYDYSTTPAEEQQTALRYIQDNQQKLLAEFFKYTKELLYPTHIEFIGFDEVSFPKITTVDDLRKTLGLAEIYIWGEHKNGMAYSAFSFDFTGDFEHGVILIAHGDNVLGWEEDLVNDKVLMDL